MRIVYAFISSILSHAQFVVHILQGDLILHKRTLEPIKTVVYGLRRYDVDRVAALSDKYDPTAKIEGFMSHKSKIYLVRGDRFPDTSRIVTQNLIIIFSPG